MNSKGISLIELLVVVAIIGILAIALGFSYVGWQGAYKVEKTTKDLYTDLMDARGRAVTQGQEFFLGFLTARTYNMYVDTNGNTTFQIATDTAQFPASKTVEYDILWNGAAIGAGVTIAFDRRGLITKNLITDPEPSIIRLSNTVDPDYDCILISAARINLGKWNVPTAGVCNAK